MRHRIWFLFLIFIVLIVNAHAIENEGRKTEEGDEVRFSPECAVVLVTSGALAGGSTAIALIPMLSPFGFTSSGVLKGSFAAWWQSTIPAVAAGSLFASLQTIAMTGVAANVVIPTAIGGATATTRIREVCEMIDSIDPQSSGGKVLSKLLVVEGAFGTLWDQLEGKVPGKVPKSWNEVKDYYSDMILGPDGKVSESWSEIKDCYSKIELDPDKNVRESWNEIKDCYSMKLDPDGKMSKSWNEINKMLDLDEKASKTWSEIKDYYSKIEVDPDKYVRESWNEIKDFYSDMSLDPDGKISKSWNEIKDYYPNVRLDPDGKVSKTWSEIKECYSKIELDPDKNVRESWNEIKDCHSNVRLDPDGKISKSWNEIKDYYSNMMLDLDGKASLTS